MSSKAERRLLGKFEGESRTPHPRHQRHERRPRLKFRITSRAGYYGRGKSGDALFTDRDDFEKDVINSNELAADYLPQCDLLHVAHGRVQYMGMQGELVDGRPPNSASGWAVKSPPAPARPSC